MSDLHRFTFEHPQIMPIEDSLASNIRIILGSDKDNNWKSTQAVMLGRTFKESVALSYERQPVAGNPFRKYAYSWHLDDYLPNKEVDLFVSSTPPSHAACTVVIKKAFMEYYTNYFPSMAEPNPTAMLEVLDKYEGHNWLEIAADPTIDPERYSTLNQIVLVEDLDIVIQPDMTIAKGIMYKNLHTANLRTTDEPVDRIIGIVKRHI